MMPRRCTFFALLIAPYLFLSNSLLLAEGDMGTDRLMEDAIARRKYHEMSKQLTLFHKNKHPLAAHKRRMPIASTNPQDTKALADFYNSTNGDQWSNNTGWMKGDPCQDRWYGLSCSEDGRVLELSLAYNVLGGSIPSSISNLTGLQLLVLYSNSIGGGLPPSLFSMSSLQILDLHGNAIRGTLPTNISMGNLTVLNLYSNKLFGEIPTGWNTPNLQTLVLSFNIFIGSLPPAIGKLTKLTSLDLSFNLLSGSFPNEYGSLRNLQILWLFNNNFNKPVLPDSWSQMTNLTDVEMDSVSGVFPSWIGTSWNKIVKLVIIDGYLNGSFPSSLCSFQKVQYILLNNNSLSGPIPDCICQLPQSLNHLELSDNKFSGPIPQCIGNLKNLTELYLSRNDLSGNLPRSLGDIRYLNVVDFTNNSLVGSVPSNYSGLTNKTFIFSLGYNKLSSFEPGLEEFFKFIGGYTCNLYGNPWNCPIPTFVPVNCQAICSGRNIGATQQTLWCSENSNCP